ncbi:hypothetical protein J6590_007368 [Homalodisca vitripennis]|nr:hypothetical protein J6590_007368 [Homalodisca vitripennis]
MAYICYAPVAAGTQVEDSRGNGYHHSGRGLFELDVPEAQLLQQARRYIQPLKFKHRAESQWLQELCQNQFPRLTLALIYLKHHHSELLARAHSDSYRVKTDLSTLRPFWYLIATITLKGPPYGWFTALRSTPVNLQNQLRFLSGHFCLALTAKKPITFSQCAFLLSDTWCFAVVSVGSTEGINQPEGKLLGYGRSGNRMKTGFKWSNPLD